MTREEAIEYLKGMKDECNDTFHKVRYVTKEEALDKAIQALQAQADGEYDGVYISYDLISRRKAIHTISACDGKSAQIKALEELPSVAIPSKVGRWIWDGNKYICSCCNHFPWRVNTEEDDEVFIDMNRTNAYKFCPYCGADMRGEQNE